MGPPESRNGEYKDSDKLLCNTRYSSNKSIIALSMQIGWNIHQLDVNKSFLNGVIEEEVYIEQPKGL